MEKAPSSDHLRAVLPAWQAGAYELLSCLHICLGIFAICYDLGESVVQLLAHDIVNVPLADNGPQTNSDTKQAGVVTFSICYTVASMMGTL
jgi:hypothetical protein